MKNMILTTILLSACTSQRSETALGVLVAIEEERPAGPQPCDVWTTLTLQTAQSGRTVVTLEGITAERFQPFKGKSVEVRANVVRQFGCGTTTVDITESPAAK